MRYLQKREKLTKKLLKRLIKRQTQFQLGTLPANSLITFLLLTFNICYLLLISSLVVQTQYLIIHYFILYLQREDWMEYNSFAATPKSHFPWYIKAFSIFQQAWVWAGLEEPLKLCVSAIVKTVGTQKLWEKAGPVSCPFQRISNTYRQGGLRWQNHCPVTREKEKK